MESATYLTPPSTGLSSIQFLTQSVEVVDPEGPEKYNNTEIRVISVYGAACLIAILMMYILRDNVILLAHPAGKGNPWAKESIFHTRASDTTKKKHIAYLKTPKTGSSTTACIFLRFGMRNNLTMFLPKLKRNFLEDADQELYVSQGKQFDLFAIHFHYNYNFLTHIVKDPIIIGQVRDPQEQFISKAFFSMKGKKTRFKNLSNKDFLDLIIKLDDYHIPYQSVYLNITKDAYHNKEYLQKILKRLNKEIDLMLVLERFDESLVLMKRLLHWSFMDIVYGKMKVAQHPMSLSITQKEKLRRTLDVDYSVYSFFSSELDNKIRKEGNNFQGEVEYFKDVLLQISNFCDDMSSDKEALFFPRSNWESDFSFEKNKCGEIFNLDVKQLQEIARN